MLAFSSKIDDDDDVCVCASVHACVRVCALTVFDVWSAGLLDAFGWCQRGVDGSSVRSTGG